jgi:hypothetical protein
MTHRLYAWLLCLLAISLYPSAPMAAAEQQAAAVHQMRLNITGSLGDFYLLYGVVADPAHAASIGQRIARVDAQLGRLETGADSALQSALEQLQPHWQDYRALLSATAAQLQHKQLPEGGAIAELIRLNRRLVSLCDDLSSQITRTQALPPDHSRELEVRLQSLTTDYIAHSIGANSLGGDAPAIDAQSKAFAAGLHRLSQQPGQAAERQQLLQNIEQKWRYIEPSLLNYRENSVPSLVNRYSARIIAELHQLAAEPPRRRLSRGEDEPVADSGDRVRPR